LVLKLRQEAPDYWEGAKCRNLPISSEYDPFFAEDDDSITEAVNFCNGEADGRICPIRHQCLMFALTNNEKYGVWGGASEITRKAIRKKLPPDRKTRKNKDWKWQSEEQALQGLDREKLIQDNEEE